jgi:hypothetical protein
MSVNSPFLSPGKIVLSLCTLHTFNEEGPAFDHTSHTVTGLTRRRRMSQHDADNPAQHQLTADRPSERTVKDGPAFVFDLDGTLVDSVYQHVLAWQEALEAAGIELAV